MKVGEKVLLPEYGGTKVILDDKVCFSSESELESFVFFFVLSLDSFFSFLSSRTISCSVMEISSVNTSTEPALFCFTSYLERRN